jgi:L-2-hydroxyglutarate oxidase
VAERKGSTATTSRGPIDVGFVVNAAGMYADHVARAYGFAAGYRMLPFKGLYLYARDGAPPLSTHIYPVPDLEMPFLGVHFTVTVDGHSKIGPTAMPAWWLENYQGLERFDAGELAGMVWRSAQLFLRRGSFRRHAATETKKLFRPWLVRHAAGLLDGVALEDFDRWGTPGIRAQLYDAERHELVMDFRFEGDDRSMHILNAVSPAFTCSLAFAEHLVDAIES